MVGILSGLLTTLGSAGAGGAKAMGEVADTNIKDKLEARKEAALEQRQRNMMELSQKFQTSERLAGQAFQTRNEARKQAQDQSLVDYMSGVKEVGGDEYSVPIDPSEFKRGMSAEGILSIATREDAAKQRETENKRNEKKDQFEADKFSYEKQRWASSDAMARQEHKLRVDALLEGVADRKEKKEIENTYFGVLEGTISAKELENKPAKIQVGVERLQRSTAVDMRKIGQEFEKTQAEIDKLKAESGQKSENAQAKKNAMDAYNATLKGGGTPEDAAAAYEKALNLALPKTNPGQPVDLSSFYTDSKTSQGNKPTIAKQTSDSKPVTTTGILGGATDTFSNQFNSPGTNKPKNKLDEKINQRMNSVSIESELVKLGYADRTNAVQFAQKIRKENPGKSDSELIQMIKMEQK